MKNGRKRPMRTSAISALVAIAVLSATPLSTPAKDLSVLIRVTYVAFLADQGSAICAASRLKFSPEDTAAFENAKNYAQWIKQRVSTGLSNDDVRSVLLTAADRAKTEAREAIRTSRSEADVFQWCTATVAPLAREVTGAYVRNRSLIDEIIQKAKSD